MSSPKKLVQQLVFGGSLRTTETIEDDLNAIDDKRGSTDPTGVRKPSAYVEVFESMVSAVRDGGERDLLSEQELHALTQFDKLCYNARYCLIRLVLRKPDQWHPISTLEGYKREVFEEGLEAALCDLCVPITALLKEEPTDTVIEPQSLNMDVAVKQEEGPECIDLTMDSGDEDIKPHISDFKPDLMESPLKPVIDSYWSRKACPPELIKTVLDSDPAIIQLDYFCQDESAMATSDVLQRLVKEKLLTLAKDRRCQLKSNAKKEDIIRALLTQKNRTMTDFFMSSKKDVKGTAGSHTISSKSSHKPKPKPQALEDTRLREMALKLLGKCIRVNFDFYRLVRRLHIICYREDEHPTALMLPALLSTFKKRNFTPYKHTRANNIWGSREDLHEYERALELDKLLDDIMEEEPEKVAARSTKTPGNKYKTPAPAHSRTTPLRTPGSSTNGRLETPGVNWDDSASVFDEQDAVVEIRKEEKMKKELQQWLYPKWKEYVRVEVDRGVPIRCPGFERFDAGHVYTRMVNKATKALGPIKEYALELEILDALLAQRFWCRGKHGKWHNRRAIVLGHLGVAATKERKAVLNELLLKGLQDALLDDDTGIVWRPNLVKRLLALEKKLKIPEKERSECTGELRTAPIVEVKAIKIPPLLLDNLGRPIVGKENTPELHRYMPLASGKIPDEPKPSKKKMGKSRWLGRDDVIVNVETRALQDYEDKGYKGFHAETRILTTLFGLLFWDIIFANVPGAFDTPYQYAPLDLLHDSFYRARKEIIDKRIKEIQDGQGPEILLRHDEKFRDRAVVCTGVSWDICSREDLLDIVDCFDGETLSVICLVFCQDYGGRNSGGPDLFVWNTEKRTCKFVEVKGPGDTPQENQKLWFDALLRANADIEVCKVIDINDNKAASTSAKKRKSSTPARRKDVDVESEDEEDYDLLDREREEEETAGNGDLLPSASAPRKRRRVSVPEGAEIQHATPTGRYSHSLSSPSLPRVNRAEVVLLTPSKRKTN